MRFDAERAKKCFEKNDPKELAALGYHYYSNSTYVDAQEYPDLVRLINVVLDYIYDVDNREVQEAFFMMVHNAINCHSLVCSGMRDCLDKMERIINSSRLDDWELAETLLIISCTMDVRYIELMNQYKEYNNSYVQEVVAEFFYDLSVGGKLE